MLKIDDNLLQTIGLGGLPTEDKRGLLTHIYETLEMRVGMRLADQMTNEQLDEFETYFEAKDDAGAFKWLETNFPNYKDIVNEEFEKLKTEVQQSAPQILATAQQNPAQPQAVPAPLPDAAQAPQFAPAPTPPDSLQTQGQDTQAQAWPQQPVAPPVAPAADPYSPAPPVAPVAPTSQPYQAPAPSPDQQAWAPAPAAPAETPAANPYQPPATQDQPQPPAPDDPNVTPPPAPTYQPMPPAWTPDQPQQGN